MADSSVLNQAIKFRYGSIEAYNAKKAEPNKINPQDVYFVVANDGETPSALIDEGFLYLNGKAFGAGVLDVSVTPVLDSSFVISVKKINKETGAVENASIKIPLSDPEDYQQLVQRVGSLESSVNMLESSVGDLRDDVDGLKDKMDLLFGDPEYPDPESDGILSSIVDQIEDVSNFADELNASVQDHEERITDLEASVASLDASVTNIYQEFYPVVERVETLETSVHTIETRVETLETSVNTIETKVETLETIVEHSVGDVSTLEGFSYVDASGNTRNAANVVELKLDSSKNASLGVFTDDKYIKVADITVGGETRHVLTVDPLAIGAAAGEAPQYHIEKLSSGDTGYDASNYASQYRLYYEQAGSKVVPSGDLINIPKDYLVKSAELKTVTEADVPYAGAEVGDKYIDFVVNTKTDPSTSSESHIYIPLKELVDTYVVAEDSSQYLDITDYEVSFDADEVVKYVDSSLKVTEKIGQINGSISDISTRLNTLNDTVTDLSTNVYRTDFIDASYAALNSSISAMELKWLEI